MTRDILDAHFDLPKMCNYLHIALQSGSETLEQFEETALAMRECQFDYAFIARYSSRSGTLATTRFEDDISSQEKARRWTILNDILRQTTASRNLLMVGREEEILITGE